MHLDDFNQLDEFDDGDDPTPDRGRRLTAAQKSFLDDLIAELAIPESGALALTDHEAESIEDLTIAEASEIISALKDARDEQRHERRYQDRRRYYQH